MLTINHITKTSQMIHEAECVRVEESQSGAPESAAGRTVYVDLASGVTGSFDSGVVYVMNSDGKTVAKYEISEA